MKGSITTKLYRIFLTLAVIALFGALIPQPVQAATPFITITGVQANATVTVHATGLPAGKTFIARMDHSDSDASSGIIVGQTVSTSDGTFDASYPIPDELHGEYALAIRIDASAGGWYAYNWFTNRTQGSSPVATPTPEATSIPVTSGAKLYIEVIAVEKNDEITVSAKNFPANVSFRVRVGPFDSFATRQATMATINSGRGGSFQFNVDLPEIVRDVKLVTIRMDAYVGDEHLVSYNVFTNADKGTIGTATPVPGTPTATPTPTVTPIASQANCQVISVTPTRTLGTREDFDVIWEVKNTQSYDWDEHVVDFRYQSGEKMHKYTAPYDLPKRVKPGETVKLLVDMLAPSKTGTYTTTFALSGDHGAFCSLPVTLRVQ